jgi:putative oxidoreductase
MDIAFLIGRIIVGVFYLYSAGNHFFQVNAMSGYAQSKGVPSPRLAVLAAGVLLLIGGLSILTGFLPVVGVIALVLFFVPVIFMMHAFWTVQDPMAKMGETVNFTKDVALLGSALMFLAIPQPWPFSIG